MRALVVVVVVAGVFAAHPPAAFAACAAPPEPGSRAFDGRIRSLARTEIIVVGVIGDRVPPDAHAGWSIYLRRARYLHGDGARRIEVTSYSDGDLVAGSDEPGASKSSSRDFLDDVAGRRAIFFASPEESRYDPGYATSSCTYNRIGRRDVREMRGFVLAALNEDELPTTGARRQATAGTLLLIAAGVAARVVRRARRAF